MSIFNIKTVMKPWGYEEILAITQQYVMKKIVINSDHRMSLQFHEIKEETVFVLEGILRIWKSNSENDYIELNPGETFHVFPEQVHRFGCPAISPCATVIMEVSTPELEDVIRLEDDYNR